MMVTMMIMTMMMMACTALVLNIDLDESLKALLSIYADDSYVIEH